MADHSCPGSQTKWCPPSVARFHPREVARACPVAYRCLGGLAHIVVLIVGSYALRLSRSVAFPCCRLPIRDDVETLSAPRVSGLIVPACPACAKWHARPLNGPSATVSRQTAYWWSCRESNPGPSPSLGGGITAILVQWPGATPAMAGRDSNPHNPSRRSTARGRGHVRRSYRDTACYHRSDANTSVLRFRSSAAPHRCLIWRRYRTDRKPRYFLTIRHRSDTDADWPAETGQ